MRIGYDAKRALANSTGLGNYARLLIDSVSVAAPDWEFFLYGPALRDNLLASLLAQRPNMTLRSPRRPWTLAKAALWRRWGLARAVRRDRCRVFHGLSHELPAFARADRAVNLVTMHDMLPFLSPRLFPWPDRAVYRMKFRHAAKAADLILAVSQRTAQDLVEILGVAPEKVRVLHQACAPRFYAPVTAEAQAAVRGRHGLNQPYVLSVGAIIERKNLLTLVKAMESLAGMTDAVLAVAGRGRSYERQVREYVAARGLEKRVRFLGHVDGGDLPALYQGAEVLAYPSAYEGFGLPIVEALAGGTPVVACTGSCLEESGGPGALYAAPGNAEDLAEILGRVLRDSDLAHDLAAKGREHARRFHADTVTRELMDLYRSLAPDAA